MKVPTRTHVLVGLAIGVVVAAIVGGLIVLGPPGEERARRMDNRRVEDLSGISSEVDLYWTRHGRLPASLEELSRASDGEINSYDPGTKKIYDYRVTGDKTYELCGEFERDSRERSQRLSKGFWSHGTGRHCFQPEVREAPR